MIPSTSNDVCRKCRAKSETIEHATGACPALAEDDYIHRQSRVANFVDQKTGYQMWAVKRNINAIL